MEEINHIYIYSAIGSYEDEISLEAVKKQYNPEAKKVVIHINSPGGEVSEGRAIFDFIKEIPQSVHTVGEGMVASIATLAFLAGDTREMKPNCDFLAHLPSMGVNGNSDDIEKAHEYVQQKKRDIAGIYAQYTGKTLDEMIEFMRQDTPISAQAAKDMGFVTFIPEFKAVARYNFQTKEVKMENTEQVKATNTKLDVAYDKMITALNKVANVFEAKNEELEEEVIVSNMDVELEDGNMIYIESEDGEFVGKVAYTSSDMAEVVGEGTYTLIDGRSLTVGADGEVTAVDEVVEASEEVEDLKNQIKELTAKLEASTVTNETLVSDKAELEAKEEKTTNEIAEMKTATAEVMKEVKALKEITAGGEPVVSKGFVKPEDKTQTKVTDKSGKLGAWGKMILN